MVRSQNVKKLVGTNEMSYEIKVERNIILMEIYKVSFGKCSPVFVVY